MKRVSEIMTRDLLTLAPEMTLREAVEALRAQGVGGAPVLLGSEVVGVVSMTDVLELQATTAPVPAFREDLAESGDWGEVEAWREGESPPQFFLDFWADAGGDVRERMARVEGPEWDVLSEHTVGEVMSRKVITVQEDDDLRTAARLLTDAGVHRVLVLEANELKGSVSASDVVRAVAQG